MGWLMAGAEQLVFDAMEALSPDHFRVGDRLDGVLGEAEARDFLTEALVLSSNAMQAGQTAALVADQIRLLLSRHVGRHRDEFALLGEHAAFCQALAEGIRDALAHGHETDVKA
ncbi:MAG: phosphate transport regulator, partial [Mesorhizobium sp.]